LFWPTLAGGFFNGCYSPSPDWVQQLCQPGYFFYMYSFQQVINHSLLTDPERLTIIVSFDDRSCHLGPFLSYQFDPNMVIKQLPQKALHLTCQIFR
jgi:hypothetical protein